MQLAPSRPNVELRRGADGVEIVVLAFPYDAHIVAAVRGIPSRRFDWDAKEWWAPADDWAGVHVADVLARFPDLTASAEVEEWLRGIDRRWVGGVGTAKHAGRGTGDGGRTLPVDPWVIGPLDPFLAAQRVAVDAALHSVLADLRAEHAAAADAVAQSRAHHGEPIPAAAAVLGGELAPFQWA